MQLRLIIGLSLALTVLPLSARAQGLSEFGGLQAGAAGLGAGLAASQNSKKLVRNTYATAGQLQTAVAAQNQAVHQYFAMGQAFEAKKQWDSAEKAFTYVLQVICKRDGPGSPAAVPALKRLVAVSQSQNKINDAIGYQKTVVAFAHAGPKPDTRSLLGAERDLSDMYVQKGDYASAEPVLRQAVVLQARVPTLTPEQYSTTLKVYGKVLRQLSKTAEADAVDATVATKKPEEAAAAVAAAVQTADAAAAAAAAADDPTQSYTAPVAESSPSSVTTPLSAPVVAPTNTVDSAAAMQAATVAPTVPTTPAESAPADLVPAPTNATASTTASTAATVTAPDAAPATSPAFTQQPVQSTVQAQTSDQSPKQADKAN